MEKYEFILRCINDKLKENADVLEMYRKEVPEKDATIRELKVKVAKLENDLSEEKQAYRKLREAHNKLNDEVADYKAANESLRAEINKLKEF